MRALHSVLTANTIMAQTHCRWHLQNTGPWSNGQGYTCHCYALKQSEVSTFFSEEAAKNQHVKSDTGFSNSHSHPSYWLSFSQELLETFLSDPVSSFSPLAQNGRAKAPGRRPRIFAPL